jgi:hypothetical protein
MTRPRQNPAEIRARKAIREAFAKSPAAPQAQLVQAAAEALGGDEAAKLTAQMAYDKHIKTMEAN